jgi:short-subunit dehydrogenase
MRLAGAVALITGASSGIGAATAASLARAGARLILTGRDEQRLAAVAARTGGLPLRADLAEPDGPDRLIESVLAHAGRIDLLICNAGAGWAGPIGDLPGQKAIELLAVNLLAPIQLARLVAPGMVQRGSGRMIFVSSIAGVTGVRHEAVYAASKAGLNYLAESLGYELAGTGAGVTVVLPGVVDTPFFGRRGRPYDRRVPTPIPPEQVARAIVTAAQRDQDVVYVPGWLRFPAWLHGTSPRTFRRLARRFG